MFIWENTVPTRRGKPVQITGDQFCCIYLDASTTNLLCNFRFVEFVPTYFGHHQGAMRLFEVYSLLGSLCIRKWQTIYINVSLQLNYNLKILLSTNKYS